MTDEFWSLNWNDRFVAKLDVEVEGVPEGAPSPVYFAEEGSSIVFRMTAEEFKQVFTALLNGCDLTYGARSTQVLWYFLRNLEYPVSLCDEIAAAILTCEDVQLAIASVIGTSEPIREAITELVITDPDINSYITNVYERLTPGQITGVIAGGDCDLSVVAGRAIAIVERLDTNNTDALEILEVGTNDEERLAQIISAFPGFGILPLDELLDFAQDVLEDFAEGYAGASTFEKKDEFAEAINCLMQANPDCNITWQELFEYVKTKIPTAGFDIAVTIFDIVTFVADGDFNNDDLVFYGMMLLQLSTITASSNFNGLTAPLLSAITRDALPSSRWEDWDECPPECQDGTNCGNPVIQISRGILVCQDELYVDVELTPLDGNYICQVGFTSSGDCQFNGWLVLSGIFTAWPQFAPYTQGVRFLGSNPTTDSGDPSTTGFNPSIILFFSTTPCTIRMRVS